MKNNHDTTGFSCLTADIGGTNVRFGVSHQADPSSRPLITDQMIYPCASFESIDVAVETYRNHIKTPLPQIACVAVAGPVKNNIVRMTNRDWLISGMELTNRFGFQEVILLNDAEAIAYVTRVVSPAELEVVKPGDRVADAPAAVIAAGTGLGVAAIAQLGGQWYPLASEAGHITLAPRTDQEIAAYQYIEKSSGPISAELLLCGEGIRRLYFAVAAAAGVSPDEATPKQIAERASGEEDSLCVQAMEIYSSLLGRFASNIALTFGARGGIYFAGNVLRQVKPFLVRSKQFRRSFESNEPMRSYLADIPVELMTLEEPGMVGASVWLEHALSARVKQAPVAI